jgi:hypothetical protein
MNYFFRFLFSFLTMEFILHFMYVVAIKDTKAWMGATPAQISMIGFWNLMIVWLKVRQASNSCGPNDLIPDNSFLYRGAFSAYGRCWTGSTLQRI